MAGYFADRRRNTRWGTLTSQAITEELDLPQSLPPNNSPPERGRPANTGPRGLRCPRPSYVASDLQVTLFASRPLSVREQRLSYTASDLQDTLSTFRPLTDAGADALDGFYFELTDHLHEPADEIERLLGRRNPSLEAVQILLVLSRRCTRHRPLIAASRTLDCAWNLTVLNTETVTYCIEDYIVNVEIGVMLDSDVRDSPMQSIPS
ncbi:hypothetical protein BKA65DRAFT_586583 [Rhexocercosporidium sp. MPI-PUGE-AT-0058]|nr:hypothetical protein BKA65DRAFT_586583 [Rhexocercosporidium sp. MPI-PUGE-AT-0058]